MDDKDADMLEIPIRFADASGAEVITTITKAPDDPFVYDYLPEKQTRLYVIEDGDTLMIIEQDDKGIFDFQELAYRDSYIYAVSSKDAALIDNLNIKVSNEEGKDSVVTIASSKVTVNVVEIKTPTTATVSSSQTDDEELHIYFDFNSSEIDKDGARKLANIISELKKSPELSINLEGHTDAMGSTEYNKKLSESRARATLLYLANKGVSAGRISIFFYGESRPIASDPTPDEKSKGTRLNRRVSITYTRKGGGVAASTSDQAATNGAPGSQSSTIGDFVEVSAATICRSVVNMEAVDSGSDFPRNVSRLWLLTKIQRKGESTSFVNHVWYFQGQEMARVKLEVKGTQWRTYSAKWIDPVLVGDWKIDVISESGKLIKRVLFKIE
ncbi:MAG: DUF2914 domain-containing protein, partial [Flavobacteriales bacterium]|nr:DUF2914 domain-containing protein [Flavobacteriales bacterium]